MKMDAMPFIDHATTQTDVYTNLQGLQSIKNIGERDEALKKVSQQFESLFVNMMMKSMRAANAVFEKDNPFTSEEGNFYRDMLDQQRALSLSHGRGLGIADAMYRQLKRDYSDSPSASSNSQGSKGFEDVSSSRKISKSFPATSRSVSNSAEDRSPGFDGDPKRFVDELIPIAKKAADAIGVDHLLLIAQSALETGWGKHILDDGKGGSSHNLFNIKANSPAREPSAWQETLEFVGGVFQKEKAAFKVYENLTQSFKDYVELVNGSERYQTAKSNAHDAQRYMLALQNAGYATDPKYSDKVMSVYQRVSEIADTSNQLGGAK
ncbi:MAG: flagellar assembly peptidoglycan hydrolase FlgJ [Agarilytica sp.]